MYKKPDFNLCVFNPLCDEPVITVYPVIMEILSSVNEEDGYLDNLLRYIIMVYDPRSPLIVNEKDLVLRKQSAADLSGLTALGDEIVEQVFSCSYNNISDLIAAYLRRFAKSKEWAAICAFEYTFWESIKELMEPINGDNSKQVLDSVAKKAAIKQEVDLDIKRLDMYYRQFFGQDEELIKKKRTTPEMIVLNR